MKKTLDEIINNENYTRLNASLVERSIELAEKIRSAMYFAEIKMIGDYEIRTVSSNGFENDFLYIATDCGYCSLEATRDYCYAGDYYREIKAARGKDRLKFLNDAKSILEEIDAIKEKRMKDIEEALNNVKEL